MKINKNNNFYSSLSHGRTEISMRDELLATAYGDGLEIPKFQSGAVRQFRLQNGLPIPCACVDKVTKEPDRESKCPICLGEGKIWDEIPIDFYHAPVEAATSLTVKDVIHKPGLIHTELEVFHIPYQFNLTKDNKIVLLVLDKEGKASYPLKRLNLYRISELKELRLDNGRLEFYKAFCYEDNTQFL